MLSHSAPPTKESHSNGEVWQRPQLARRVMALGLAIGLGAVAAWWFEPWVWRVGASLAAVALLAWPRLKGLGLGAAAPWRSRLLLLLAVACAAQATLPGLLQLTTTPWVRVWNVYHYFLGAKYFPELGYQDLYVATLAADEAADDYWSDIRKLRDLETYATVPRQQALAGYDPANRFSPQRWRDFQRDVKALQVQRSPSGWRHIFTDRGYNPTPLWTSVGRLLTRFPADWLWALKILCSLDLLLLVYSFWSIHRSFGRSVMAAVLLLFSLSPVNEGRIVGGFLQYDWFCALALALCYVRRRRPWPAAACLAYAIGSRVFPVLLLVSATLPWMRRYVLEGRILKFHVRWAAALAVSGGLALAIATLGGGGVESWTSFVSNIEIHQDSHRYGQQRIGWAHAFTRDIRGLDFSRPDAEERRGWFTQQRPLFKVSGALLLILWGLATWRRSTADALLLGLALFFVLAVSSRYYWACLALLPMLARPGPAGHRRWRFLVTAQAALMAGLGLAQAKGFDGFSLYSVFDLLLALFLVTLLLTYIVQDLKVYRRRRPLASWYRSLPLAGCFFVALFLFLCWLRMPDPEAPIRDVDEAVSALIAESWLTGGVPYRDAIDQRGPVTYLIYAAVFALTSIHDMVAVHWALLGLILLTCGVVFVLAQRLRPTADGVAVAYGAAFLVALGSFTYRRSQMLAFHTEWPLMLFSAVAMLCLWLALKRFAAARRCGLYLQASGACFALAFLSKQPGIFDAGAAALFVLLWQWRRSALFSLATWRLGSQMAVGFFSTLMLTGLYFAWRGAFGDFVFYYWTYNVEHYTAVIPVADRLAALDPFAHRRHYLTANPLLLVGSLLGIGLALGRSLRRKQVDGSLLVALWLVFGYFGASYSGRNFGHYFIQILVPASLTTAFAWVQVWQWIPTWRGFAKRLPDGLILARGLVVVATAIALTSPVIRFSSEIGWRHVYQARPVDDPRQALLAAIRQHTEPDQSIFVWGYYPELYVLAPRRPASRYSNTNYLTGMLPWENHAPGVDTSAHIVDGSWDVLMAELEASRPALVVDTSVGNHRYYGKYPVQDFPPLQRFLERDYRLDRMVKDRKERPVAGLWVRRQAEPLP